MLFWPRLRSGQSIDNAVVSVCRREISTFMNGTASDRMVIAGHRGYQSGKPVAKVIRLGWGNRVHASQDWTVWPLLQLKRKIYSVGICKPNSVRHCCRGDHSSRRRVTTPLKRPTRAFGEPSRFAGFECLRIPIHPPLFGLAPCGVCHATFITERPVRSYRTFSPLPLARRYFLCGTFRRTALKPPLPDVIRHTALRSSDFPPPAGHSPAKPA